MPGIAQIRARNQTGSLAFEHDPEKVADFSVKFMCQEDSRRGEA
ncbi:hypothetical protein MAXJ12_02681 [Mesorhizobium alhagi CCNWXJ12-2]|jgi:hypothetical protein|uniref:Uncharacterized protein n=1 Tax=Mesorhizobium alhagi CCNWXJ12-2 TaxID=1107882 RepID=H0HK45_9HYPH|nr:hypothetical protein MAXJ12_02681 [Mesorhizobium alhagi CCNWXJ12-2]